MADAVISPPEKPENAKVLSGGCREEVRQSAVVANVVALVFLFIVVQNFPFSIFRRADGAREARARSAPRGNEQPRTTHFHFGGPP